MVWSGGVRGGGVEWWGGVRGGGDVGVVWGGGGVRVVLGVVWGWCGGGVRSGGVGVVVVRAGKANHAPEVVCTSISSSRMLLHSITRLTDTRRAGMPEASSFALRSNGSAGLPLKGRTWEDAHSPS